MGSYDYFSLQKNEDENLTRISQYVVNNLSSNKMVEKFEKNMVKFATTYPPQATDRQIIVYHYWYTLFVYHYQKTKKEHFAESTFSSYFISNTRILEFVIFLSSVDMLKASFIGDTKEKNLFTVFRQANLKNEKDFFAVVEPEGNVHRKKKIYAYGKSYYSSLPIQPPGQENELDFAFFFKIYNKIIKKIFSWQEPTMSFVGGKRGGRWERTELQTEEEYLQYLIERNFDGLPSQEDKNEAHNRKNKLSSVDLITNNQYAYLGNNTGGNINFNMLGSQFKKYLISKAISRGIAKQNLSLKSRYNIPDIDVLKRFIPEVIRTNNICSNLIFLTIIFGISTSYLIRILAGLDRRMKFFDRDTKIRFLSIKKLFANPNIDEEISKTTTNKDVEVYVSNIVADIWKKTTETLKVEFGDIERSEDRVLSRVKKYYHNTIKAYPKNITLPFGNLSLLFLHIYRTTQNGSDVSLLFTGAMSKNDEARICYAASPKRLIKYELWQMELIKILGLKEVLEEKCQTKLLPNIVPADQSIQWHGSRLYLKGSKFKYFLQKILSLECQNKHDEINKKMIFFKYVLSCLLAARGFRASLSLENYSYRENILLIQEKGKNIYSSKRIIPLTEMGGELVGEFLHLREKYGINSFYPVLIMRDNEKTKEIDMTKKSILNWIENQTGNNIPDDIEYICQFIQSVPFNFGRHIFTTIAIQSSEIKASYIDAYLGHFKMGTEDQGIYSNFDNQDYFKSIREILTDIERIYIPNWKSLW